MNDPMGNKDKGPEGHSKELSNWADPAMYTAEPTEEGVRVALISATPDPLGSLASMCSMYEGKSITRRQVTDEMRMYYFNEQLKTHLKAPLEAIDFHFLIEGVDRAFTHQIVRQRTAVYAQESMRFAVKDNMADEIEMPGSIMPGSLEAKAWEETVRKVSDTYQYLIANGVPAEDARGLAPHATRTKLHYKSNLRNFAAEIGGKRLCTQAQFHWRLVASLMLQAMRNYNNGEVSRMDASDHDSDGWQFDFIADSVLFRPVCYQVGHCVFESDMDRHCSIRPRVQEGKFDEIDIREWLIDPHAAKPKGEG